MKAIQHPRTAGGAHAVGAENIFVGDGDTGQWPCLPCPAALRPPRGPGQGRFIGHSNKSVQAWIEPFDPLQQRAGQFFAAELAGGKAGAQLAMVLSCMAVRKSRYSIATLGDHSIIQTGFNAGGDGLKMLALVGLRSLHRRAGAAPYPADEPSARRRTVSTAFICSTNSRMADRLRA
jgi:hypothetical protein